MTRDRKTIFASLIIVAAAGGAAAQTYPSKPIRLVIPFAQRGAPALGEAVVIGAEMGRER